jgi:ubiquinone/menaquinone biosynthesis C-methylase UbiE
LSLRTDYDTWHQRVFDSEPEHEDADSPWYQLVREKIGSVQGLRVLEVACGRGGFVRELARAGAQVTGCDFSMSALAVAQARIGRLNRGARADLIQGDAQSLPFGSESFDLIVSCETIEHLPNVRSALREMWRVARRGAKLFLITPNYANLMGLYDLYSRVRHPNRRDDQPFDRRQWIPQIRNFVSTAGWKIIYSDGRFISFLFSPGAIRYFCRSLNRIGWYASC